MSADVIAQISSIGVPASACLKAKAICSSEYRFLFMALFLPCFRMPEKMPAM
jgi:hypothetical protein